VPWLLDPPRKRPLVPIAEEAGWAVEPVWMILRKELSFVPARTQTLDCSTHSLFTILTMLSWLHEMEVGKY